MKNVVRLDPTTISASACMRKIQLMNILGYQPKIGKDEFDFGQSLHRAAALFREDRVLGKEFDVDKYIHAGVTYYAGRLCPKKSPRDLSNLVDCIRDYCTTWNRSDPFVPLVSPEGKVGVELPFEFPGFYETENTEVRLCGVLDAIGTENKIPRILDIKHSATKNVDVFMSNYERSIQFIIYSWAIRQMNWVQFYPGVRVDGIFISNEYRGARLIRSNVIDVPEFQVERVIQHARDVARELCVQLERGGEFTYNFSQCSQYYKKCEFDPLCNSPAQFQVFGLKAGYTQRVYNPATFGE